MRLSISNQGHGAFISGISPFSGFRVRCKVALLFGRSLGHYFGKSSRAGRHFRRRQYSQLVVKYRVVIFDWIGPRSRLLFDSSRAVATAAAAAAALARKSTSRSLMPCSVGSCLEGPHRRHEPQQEQLQEPAPRRRGP